MNVKDQTKDVVDSVTRALDNSIDYKIHNSINNKIPMFTGSISNNIIINVMNIVNKEYTIDKST